MLIYIQALNTCMQILYILYIHKITLVLFFKYHKIVQQCIHGFIININLYVFIDS